MSIKTFPSEKRVRVSGRRARRGAALMFAIAAILMIMTVVSGLLFFVESHVDVEVTSQSYSRAIQIAEAAANWQLNQMSRTLLTTFPANATPPQGYMHYSDFNAQIGTSDFGVTRTPVDMSNSANNAYASTYAGGPNGIGPNPNGVSLNGSVVTWVTDRSNATAPWIPPNDFRLYAIGYDPDSLALNKPIAREIIFDGTATGLEDRYALFAQNSLTLNSDPSNPAKTWFITSSYIGTNGAITINNQYPTSTALGVRLGNGATAQPGGIGSWPTAWDAVGLPDPVSWPTVSDVTKYIYANQTPDQLSGANNNNQIWYRDQNGHWQHFAGAPTQLTSAEFDQSQTGVANPYHVICLSVDPNSTNGNLFYFTNINMRANDVLVLDVGAAPNQTASQGPTNMTTLRILLNGTPAQNMVVTNLAYCHYNAAFSTKLAGPSVVWFDNSTVPLQFLPAIGQTVIDGTLDGGNFFFQVDTTIRGLVYGLNSQGNGTVQVSTQSPPTGITPAPPPVTLLTINNIVANNVQVDASKCRVFIRPQPSGAVEDAAHRYVLYYQIYQSYYSPPVGTTNGVPAPPINYGPFSSFVNGP